MSPEPVQVGAALLFAIAVIHTFSVKFFESLAERESTHSGVWRMLSEVEVVFGFWAMVLIVYLAIFAGPSESLEYLESRNFTEPMFVFAIMVVAASRPVLDLALWLVTHVSRLLPLSTSLSTYIVTLSLVPLLGSFITEPAAMTLAAFLLRDNFYRAGLSSRLQYATLGVLFVNVSIGGTLTPYAAPPILMVADTWDWGLLYMLEHFGWRSILIVLVNAVGVAMIFRSELTRISQETENSDKAPLLLTAAHLLFLFGIVAFSHHIVVFMALLLFFIGFTVAYPRHQDKLILREGLMVGFFLAGLVVLGGQQRWWLQPMLEGISPTAAYYGATALTAITDNAALTYLGSLVDGLTEEFKYSLVAGAVTGGGLTVIANAPNPAGYSILKDCFDNKTISSGGILAAALLPTLVAIIVFEFL